MLAPIDAVATVEVPEDGGAISKIVLRLNMRTLALAKAGGVNLLKANSLGDLDPLDLAVLVQAFATPQHPDFAEEHAFALLVRHAAETKAAIESLSAQFAAAAGTAGGGARPTKPGAKKPPTS